MGHINRSPNDYDWILSYRGSASGLKILIFLMSEAYTMMYDSRFRMKIAYGRIRKNIPQLSHKENSFISSCVNDAVSNADGFTKTVCSVSTCTDCVCVTYTRKMSMLVSNKTARNYFTFSAGTAMNLPTVNAVKLYMMLRRYYNMLGFARIFDSVIRRTFASETTRNDSLYRSVKNANTYLENAGICYSLEKKGKIWKFTSA